MLPSRAASVSQAGPAHAGPAATDPATAPFARLERQLQRGAPRLGIERALADRVFTVVARAICRTEDDGQDEAEAGDGTADDVALVAALLCAPAPVVAPDPSAMSQPKRPSSAAASTADAPRKTDPHRITATAAARPFASVTPVAPVAGSPLRVAAVSAAARPLHQQRLSQGRGLGRAVVLGLVLAVVVVMLTLDLLGQRRASRSTAASEDGAATHRRVDTTRESTSPGTVRPSSR